jgi:uridylate kinase, putative
MILTYIILRESGYRNKDIGDILDKVVVSIGGSVLVPGENDSEYIGKLAGLIKEISKDVQLVIVCGGGKTARYYIKNGSELNGTTYDLDLMGIDLTRVNAKLLMIALGGIKEVPVDPKVAASMSSPGNVVIMGGTEPGHTTDAVAAMVAKEMKADRLINATSVDAVYSDDPRKVKDAERYSKLTIEQLRSIVYSDHGAGRSSVFDPLGIKILAESKIDLSVVDGRDLQELKNAILGKKIKGTSITSQ